MRVGVHECPAGQQPAGNIDRGEHRFIGIPRLAIRLINRASGEKRHLRRIDPVRVDRVRHRQTVRLA